MSTDDIIRAEADRLLSSGLRALLDSYGEVHIVGSYALRLMVWRDLDIHLVISDLRALTFFELGRGIEALLSPARMHFRNELIMNTPGLPRGLYWGVYLGDERQGAWKLDVWASDAAAFRPSAEFQERIRAALTDSRRATILRIKSAVWSHPEYRRRFSSADVYRAVIEADVTTVEGFFAYLAEARPS